MCVCQERESVCVSERERERERERRVPVRDLVPLERAVVPHLVSGLGFRVWGVGCRGVGCRV